MGDVNFTVEAIDKASSAIDGIRGAILTFNQGLQLAQQVIAGVNQVMDATVGLYVEQANAVRTLTQINGKSAESNSRLIETLDDYKLSVEDAITAQRKLATQGQDLTIPTLARLSDEYLKLDTAVERQTFLTDNFGRSSAGWAEAMVKGSAAIKANAAAISDKLILDQKAIDKAREYEIQMDNLNDTWKAFKMNVAESVLPTLNSAMSMENARQRANELGISLTRGVIPVYKTYDQLLQDIADHDAMMARMNGIDVVAAAADTVNTELEKWKGNLASIQSMGPLKLIDDTNKGSMQSTRDVFNGMLSDFGAGNDKVRALGEAFGYLSEQEADNMVRLYNFDKALKAWQGEKITKDIILRLWYEQFAITQEDLDQNPPPSGGGEQPGFAGGGRFKGWAMVGDSPGGGRTPYTEWVYAPKGAIVYNQSQMSGHSAPPMASGGVMPPASDAPLDLSDMSIRKLADALNMAILRGG